MVPVFPFAPEIVIVVIPALDPAVTVKVTVPPELVGVAADGDTVATVAFEFDMVKVPPYALSLTVNVIVWPVAVNEIAFVDTFSGPGVGVGDGVGVGTGVGVGLTVGVGEGVGAGEGVAVGDAVGAGVGLGIAVGAAV